MKKLSLKMLTIIALTMTMVISLSIGLFSTKEQVYADSVEIPVSELGNKEEFLLGETLVMPEKITIDNREYTNGIIILPDANNTVLKASQLQLTLTGNYVVRYYNTATNGDVSVAERTVPVKESAYYLSDSKYGSVVYASKSSQTQIKNEKFSENFSNYYDINTNTTRTLEDALIVRLEEDCEFNYSQPIDLRNVDSNGLSDILAFQPNNADVKYDKDYDFRKYVQDEFMQLIIYPKLGYQEIVTDANKVSSLSGRVYPELSYEKEDEEYGVGTGSPYELFKYYHDWDKETYDAFKFLNLDNVYINKETNQPVSAKDLQDLYKKMDEDNFAANPSIKKAELNAKKLAHFKANFTVNETALNAFLDKNMPVWPNGENVYGCLTQLISKVFTTSDSVYIGSKHQFINDGRINRVIVIKITDAHDPTKYVEVKASLSESAGTTFTAAATSQKFYGLHAVDYHENPWTGDVKMETIDHVDNQDASKSDIYRRWDGLNYGAAGYLGLTDYRTGTVKLQYDLKTNSVYLRTTTIDNDGVQGNFSKYPTLINALSSTGVYDKSAVFGGFTTGEVYLSIKMEEFEKDMASRIDLISIGNKSGSELVATSGDGQQFNSDTIAPQLSINIDETDTYGVYAPVGKDFVLPTANVYDLNLKGSYTTAVYSWYNTSAQRIVPVVGGKFKVEENTIYTAVYTAVDNFGNVTTRSFDIVAKKTQEDYFAINHGLDGVTLEQGQKFTLPAWEIKTLNDAEKLKLKIKVYNENESFELDLDNPKFIPNYYGTYKIVYECSDNLIENYEYSVELNCVHSESIVFSSKLNLPRYFAAKRYYSFDRIYANTYLEDAPVSNIADFYVSFDGGEYVKRNATRFYIDAQETVQVKYVYNGAVLESEIIPVVDVGYKSVIKNNKLTDNIYLKKYFVGDFEVDDYKKDASGNIMTNTAGKPIENPDLIMKSTVSEGDNLISFINEIDADLFNVKYVVPQNYSQFKELSFIFTDACNVNVKYVINLSFGQEIEYGIGGRDPVTKNYAYVKLNGEYLGKYESAFAGIETTITYNSQKNEMVITSGKSKFAIDMDFAHFESKTVFFDLELGDIYGKFSGIQIKELCYNSMLNQKHTDTVVPQIVLEKTAGNYNIGQVITLKKARFMDLLSGVDVATIKFTVTFNGEPVQSVDGVTLDGTQDWNKDYQIELTSVGAYTMTYYCKDNLGNAYEDNYSASVVDSEAPVITIQNDYQENTIVYVKAGQEFSFEYDVQDDSEVTHYVSLYHDSYLTLVLNNCGKKFTLVDKGVYTVKIVALDAVGNFTVKTFKVEVR